jgi:hypothetical protein
MKTVKLTPDMLKQMIKEEAAMFAGKKKPEDVKAEEVDADELGSDKALEKHIDVMKALKIKEERLVAALKLVREQKARVAKSLMSL